MTGSSAARAGRIPLRTLFTVVIAAMGGFLFGFDASVISGTLTLLKPGFGLSDLQLGWLVSAPSFSAMFSMLFAGRLSDLLGRKPVMMGVAAIYLTSAILSALAPTYGLLFFSRLLGGVAFGGSLILGPLYISEISPSSDRGRLVSIQQLNIVLGFSAAYFSNFLLVKNAAQIWPDPEQVWRLMFAIECLPAAIYLLSLNAIPESPWWLMLRLRKERAESVLHRLGQVSDPLNMFGLGSEGVRQRIPVRPKASLSKAGLARLISPALRSVFALALLLGVIQQITGINVVFFYAPVIFAQTGLSTDASLAQAVVVGVINLAFTLLALVLIDRVGRRPLLLAGLAGVVMSMLLVSYGFDRATYHLDAGRIESHFPSLQQDLSGLEGVVFEDDAIFREALSATLSPRDYEQWESELMTRAIEMNHLLVLFGILGFVASFAFSLGPVMWVMLPELFQARDRALAISIVGFANSLVSWGVQLLFPLEIRWMGPAATYGLYALFGLAGFLILLKALPETKGRSLE
jgi:SP family arabinose:H+ symporter-like MFS transporter